MPDPVNPNISALAQSGPSAAGGPMPAPNQPAPPPEAMTPAMAVPDVTDRSINPAQAPPPPPGTPNPGAGGHQRLLSMVQGIADGLSAFGTSLATHGKEGGAAEVQQLEAGRQQMRQSAQAAAQAQRDAELRNKLTTAQTNEANTHNIFMNYSLKNDMAKSDMSVKSEATKLGGEQFNLFAGTGMNPAQIDALVKGGPADAKTSNMLQANAQQNARIASQLLPADNPTLANLNALLKDPTTPPATLVLANNRLQAELKAQEGVNDAKIKEATVQATAPFGDRAATINDALLKRYQVLNPTAKELPQGYALTPDATAKDFDRVDKIMQQTESAEATKANHDIINGMREQMLDLAQGAKIPGDETKTGDEYIASLPTGVAATIKAIHEGREAPPSTGSRSPAAQTILSALNHAYGDYDATKYPTYLDLRKKFADGPEGKGINSLNTVETHLARMFQHVNAPNTSGGITGKVTGFFGDKDVRALDIDRTAVATELSKAYAAGQISEGEVKDWEAKLDFTQPGMTSGKMSQNIKEIDGLLEGKQSAYQSQWQAGVPAPGIVTPFPIINADAAAARSLIRGQGAPAAKTGQHAVGDQVTLKNGQTVVIKTMNPDGTFTY